MFVKPCDIVGCIQPTPRVVVTSVNDSRCRYHRPNTIRSSRTILPPEICPLLYMAAYPFLFALHTIQDITTCAKMGLSSERLCPLGHEGVTYKVFAEENPLSLKSCLRNSFTRLMTLFMPFETHNKTVGLEILDNGQCPINHTMKQRVFFNVDGTDEICPAAANSVYPLINYAGDFSLGCPDYRTHVLFSLDQDSGGKDFERKVGCDRDDLQVQVDSYTGDCAIPIELHRWYSVDEVIKECAIPCLSSYHVAFPYLYALSMGGQLGYLSRRRNEAGICCPNADVGVQYMVSDDNNVYSYQRRTSYPDCPRVKVHHYDIVELRDFRKILPFYKSLDELYVTLKKLQSSKLTSDTSCPVRICTRENSGTVTWLIASH